ncbi:lamin tail domain-containing protein [Cohnella faecalis]|nr:lamin tail domain-containing protein [Cohnella faecalis]
MKRVKRQASRFLTGLAAAALVATGVPGGSLLSFGQVHAEATESYPNLLITEIVFNSPNTGTPAADVNAWEYVELYNNGDTPVALGNYYIYRENYNSSTNYKWSLPSDKVLLPGQTIVARGTTVGDNGLLAAFNTAYALNPGLSEDQVATMDQSGGGNLPNTGTYTVSVKNVTDDQTVVSARYNDNAVNSTENGDDGNNKSVVYKYDPSGGTAMLKLASKQTPTPGTLVAGQIPPVAVPEPSPEPSPSPSASPDPVPAAKPAITYVPSVSTTTAKDLAVSAQVSSEAALTSVVLHYKKDGDASYASAPMTVGAAVDGVSTATGVIPQAVMTGTGKIQYYLEAENAAGIVRSPEAADAAYELNIEQAVPAPYLLITEIVFNSPNYNGGDVNAWEYVEVYNNSDKPIPLRNYRINYADLTGKTVRTWEFKDDKTIMPGKTMVLRAYSSDANGTLAKFNEIYKLSPALTDSDISDFTGEGNLENAPGRIVSIVTKSGETIVSASYNVAGSNADDLNNTSVTYRPDESGGLMMVKIGSKAAPTPGKLLAGQAPATPVQLPADFLSPIIEHKQSVGSTSVKELKISADVTDETAVQAVKLFYKTDKTSEFASVSMQLASGNRYEAVVPATVLDNVEHFYYYFEATDGFHTVSNPGASKKPYDIRVFNSVSSVTPDLLITELVPDNKGSDAYEYVEVYNNTSRTVNLKDYQIVYEFFHGSTIRWDIANDLLLPSKETAVVWVQSNLSMGKPVADFNAHWGVNLPDTKVAPLYALGMSNSDEGRILIAPDAANPVDHARNAISQAWYNVGEDEVNDDGASVVYEYPKDGSNKMYKRSAGMLATPGALIEGQVPETPVQVADDSAKPVISYQAPEGARLLDSITLSANVTDNKTVQHVTLMYKRNIDSEYRAANMIRSKTDPNQYVSETIAKKFLLGAASMDYYFEASDGQNVARTTDNGAAVYRMTFDQKSEPLWFDIQPGAFLRGTTTVQGNSQAAGQNLSLSVDETVLPSQKSPHEDAILSFRADDMQSAFKNGLIVNGELAGLLPDGKNLDPKYVVLPKSLLKPGENKILITAGNSISPTGTEGNNDDYRIENIEITLWNGMKQPIASARGKKLDTNAFTDINPEERQKVGDGSGYFEYLELTIDLPDSLFYGVSAKLDTTKLADGEHSFRLATASGASTVVNAIVDNTAPVFESFSIEEGKAYRGKIDFNATTKDEASGIASVTATLDGTAISLPAQANAVDLKPGAHVFLVTVKDKAGNDAVRSATFTIANEYPLLPSNPLPAFGATDVNRNATLSVNVTDPNGDPMDVTFRQAFRYDFNEQSDVKGYSNATDREPPLELTPTGETAFSGEAVTQVSRKDGTYFVTDADGLFPYQRYEFKLNENPQAIAEIEVVWEGHSLPDRQVTMYTWNYNTGKWVAAASGIGDKDFQLKAKVNAGDMVRNKTIHVLIQDLVPTAADGVDFTFAWASDTQYYADSYPEIFEKEMKYIADKKDEKKIAYAIHTGDLVDDWDRPDEWAVASRSMRFLEDAGIPYGVVTGNHDVNHAEGNYTEYWKYFGRDRFENQPTYGDDLNNNRDHFDLVSAKGQDFLIMYLGWNVQEETVKWANEVLKKYPNRYVIIGTHEYISPSGDYSGQGEKIWNEIVAPNDNVQMVLCGHLHGVAYNVKHVGERTVVEMLADYQSGPQGGLGYMRFLEFNLAEGKIHVSTYSAYLDDSNYFEEPGKDDFDLPYKTQNPSKQVATDYIGVNVYGSSVIGSKKAVASGKTATVSWSSLAANTTYYWYATAKDGNSEGTVSDIWKFSTGTSISGTNPGTNPETNPGTGTGTDTGSGTGTTPTTPGGSAVEISPKDIPESGSSVLLTIEKGTTTIALSADALAKIGDRPVTLQADGGAAVTLPASVIQALSGTLADGSRLTVSLGSVPQPIAGEAAQSYGAKLKAGMTIAGSTIDLVFGKQDSSGKTTAIDGAGKPVSIELTTGAVRNDRLAGIYRIDADGSAHWIGGSYSNGSYKANVEQAGMYVVMEYKKPYDDLAEGNWAYDYVQELSFKGIVSGVSDSSFGSDKATTRAEFIALIVRALGMKSSSSGGTSFRDVQAGSWYEEAVKAAVEAGIVSGVSETSFAPAKTITREQMAVMIVRALEYRKGSLGNTGSGASFADGDKISDWAKDSIGKAFNLGIIAGKENNAFDPAVSAKRSESAKVVYMLLQQLN